VLSESTEFLQSGCWASQEATGKPEPLVAMLLADSVLTGPQATLLITQLKR